MAKYRCCDNMPWKAVADLGHAAGADFDFGRCAACGARLLDVFTAVSSTITVIGEAAAQRKALKAWFE